MKYASIDIGTNTVLLCIVEFKEGKIIPLIDKHAVARLGENVNQTKRISHEATDRLLTILYEYKKIIDENDVAQIFVTGTSVFRDAKNANEIISRVKEKTTFDIEILHGEIEAQCSFLGCTQIGNQITKDNAIVIDIGGGSTEIIIGNTNGILVKKSFDIGVVRLSERFGFYTNVTNENEEKLRKEIKNILRPHLSIFNNKFTFAFGIAGTIVTLAQLAQNLTRFSPALHNYKISLSQVDVIYQNLKIKSLNEIIAYGVDIGRADVFLTGCVIVQEIMQSLSFKEITASIYGLRYGVILYNLQHNANTSYH